MYHLIFCAKYRRNIFADKTFGEALKQKFVDISKKYDFTIDTIDLDYLKPYQIVRVLKQEANIWAWQNFDKWLSTFYWKSHHLFTRGYFCSSVGNISADTVHEYLEKQGSNE